MWSMITRNASRDAFVLNWLSRELERDSLPRARQPPVYGYGRNLEPGYGYGRKNTGRNFFLASQLRYGTGRNTAVYGDTVVTVA